MYKKILAIFSLLSVILYSGFSFGGSHNWDEVLAEAKKEGKVNWFQWYLVDAFAEFIKPFEEEYGIDVVITQGKHTVNIDKAVAEMGRSKGDIDVLSLGFDKIPDLDMPGMFIKLSDELPKDKRTTNLAGVDAKDYAYAWWGNQSGFAYDPEKVDESKLPQSPEEIAQFWEANPGKFGFNYENGGSGPSFFQNVLRVMGTADFTSGDSSPEKIAKLKPGIDFFNKYADKYIITAGNADSIQRISDKEIWMAPAWEDHLAGLQKRGEVRKEIKMYIPSMGMNGGGNGVAIPKNAPNPHAALVFANWLLSAETQTGFNRDFGAAPLHPEADDSSALISNAQRAFRQNWASNPFSKDLADHFIEEVMMNR